MFGFETHVSFQLVPIADAGTDIDANTDTDTTEPRVASLTGNREAVALGVVGTPPRPQAEGRV